MQAAQLTNWTFNSQTNQLEIILEDSTTPRYFLLSNPSRLVLDLPNTQLGNVEIQQNYSGVVRQVRTSQFTEEITRIVLEFAPETLLSQEQIQLIKVKENHWQVQALPASNPARTSLMGNPPFPPASFYRPPTGARVQVPPLIDPSSAEVAQNVTPTNAPQPRADAQTPTIEFGQPFPRRNNSALETRETPLSRILKAGTQFPLQYVGETPLILSPGKIVQEVLLLSEAIREENGQIVIPAKTPVIGRFETNEQGSHFISQALVLNEENLLLNARSHLLERGESNGENTSSPQPVKIEPGFILRVQLTQDWQY